MRYGVLGTGTVGRTIGGRLVALGHEVTMGSRQAGGGPATAWVAAHGERARQGTFADAADAGDLVVNATAGIASVDAVLAAGADRLAGKVLVDIANPLDFSAGMPPAVRASTTDSLAERIQAAVPGARVVKALNTMTAAVMVDPASLPGRHTVFVAGDDPAAKAEVGGLLAAFGWPPADVLDLGGIAAARGLELFLPFWLQVMGATGTPHFNIAVVRA